MKNFKLIKKVCVSVFALTMVLILVGCNNKTENDAKENSNDKIEKQENSEANKAYELLDEFIRSLSEKDYEWVCDNMAWNANRKSASDEISRMSFVRQIVNNFNNNSKDVNIEDYFELNDYDGYGIVYSFIDTTNNKYIEDKVYAIKVDDGYKIIPNGLIDWDKVKLRDKNDAKETGKMDKSTLNNEEQTNNVSNENIVDQQQIQQQMQEQIQQQQQMFNQMF